MTLEERAVQSWEERYPNGSDVYRDAQIDGYIAGATEQKEIDDAKLHERFEKVLNGQKWDLIDKACEWIAQNFNLGSGVVYPNGELHYVTLDDFRKTMEE